VPASPPPALSNLTVFYKAKRSQRKQPSKKIRKLRCLHPWLKAPFPRARLGESEHAAVVGMDIDPEWKGALTEWISKQPCGQVRSHSLVWCQTHACSQRPEMMVMGLHHHHCNVSSAIQNALPARSHHCLCSQLAAYGFYSIACTQFCSQASA